MKSEGTVCTEAVSTSIREEVDGESAWRTSGGGGARFYESRVELIFGACLVENGCVVEVLALAIDR